MLRGRTDRLARTLAFGAHQLDRFFARKKDTLSAMQSAAGIFALFAGGAWALSQVAWQRQLYPHVELTHTVGHFFLPHSKFVLNVDLTIKNTGRVRLNPLTGVTTVDQILPPQQSMDEKLAAPLNAYVKGHERYPDWGDTIGQRDEDRGDFIEPGEIAQLHYEFILSQGPCVVRILTRIDNPDVRIDGKLSGWEYATMYAVRPPVDCIAQPGQVK